MSYAFLRKNREPPRYNTYHQKKFFARNYKITEDNKYPFLRTAEISFSNIMFNSGGGWEHGPYAFIRRFVQYKYADLWRYIPTPEALFEKTFSVDMLPLARKDNPSFISAYKHLDMDSDDNFIFESGHQYNLPPVHTRLAEKRPEILESLEAYLQSQT